MTICAANLSLLLCYTIPATTPEKTHFEFDRVELGMQIIMNRDWMGIFCNINKDKASICMLLGCKSACQGLLSIGLPILFSVSRPWPYTYTHLNSPTVSVAESEISMPAVKIAGLPASTSFRWVVILGGSAVYISRNKSVMLHTPCGWYTCIFLQMLSFANIEVWFPSQLLHLQLASTATRS